METCKDNEPTRGRATRAYTPTAHRRAVGEATNVKKRSGDKADWDGRTSITGQDGSVEEHRTRGTHRERGE